MATGHFVMNHHEWNSRSQQTSTPNNPQTPITSQPLNSQTHKPTNPPTPQPPNPPNPQKPPNSKAPNPHKPRSPRFLLPHRPPRDSTPSPTNPAEAEQTPHQRALFAKHAAAAAAASAEATGEVLAFLDGVAKSPGELWGLPRVPHGTRKRFLVHQLHSPQVPWIPLPTDLTLVPITITSHVLPKR